MRISFNYPCDIAVVTTEGDMSTWRFGVGEVVEVSGPSVVTLENRSHRDLELEDGSIMMNVPLRALHWEPEYADCV